MTPVMAGKAKLVDMVVAFQYRNYRYFWLATMLASAGRWMETVILSWLVLDITDSPLQVGIVAGCRWVGYVLGPIFGTLVDRLDRRRLLISVVASSVIYSFALAILVTTGLVQYWQTIIIALIAGIAHAFDLPLRYAITADLVDKRDLTNAVVLSTIAIDVTAILGPAIAGPMIDVIGISGVCWVLTFDYLLNTLALYMMQSTSKARTVAERSMLSNLLDGARYIHRNPPIFALLIMAALLNLFEFPLRYALVPVFARNVLKVGATGFGFLLAASGAGALAGAIVVALLAHFRHKAWLCIVASVLAGITAVAFCLSNSYRLSLVLIGSNGLTEAIGSTTLAVLLLLLTPTEMRGRVMGVRSFAILPLALGNLISGAMASQFGAPVAGMTNATILVVLILATAIVVPSLRKSG